MSIEWLHELARSVRDAEQYFYACPISADGQWQVARSVEELMPVAKLAAANTRLLPVTIVRLVPPVDTAPDALFLVPVAIDPPDPDGNSQVRWATICSLESAKFVRDMRFRHAPVFGMEVQETVWTE